ncbi:MAG: methyl-accepting chemotaxis protein [Gammaproteobacteria bacterium]|nr:methyl-accepting chemotaxis protein [Gammaproteobacteria bacterium]MBU1978378.1 methyl-accepting chemotaxis protein [Gammaproteobacteria bacterium]
MVINAKNNYQEWRSSSATESLMALAIDLGSLTHRLQIERGATVGFIQSKGERFASDLPGYRTESDKRLAELKDQYGLLNKASSLPSGIKSVLDTTLAELDKMGDMRTAASQFRVPAAEAASYYTKTIASILDTIPAISEINNDMNVAKRMPAYLALLRAKERNGQERALLAGVFTVNKIESAQYRALLSHIAAQQSYLVSFDNFASKEVRELYKQKMSGNYVNEVEAMQKVVIDKAAEGQFEIEPSKWFGVMTAKIDAMYEVEEAFAGQIKALVAEHAGKARTALTLHTGIDIALLLAMIGLGYSIAISITRPINSLKAGIVQIQGDNDLTSRVEISGKDEIGQVAEAFNHLVGSLQSIIQQVSTNAVEVLHLSEQLAATASQVASSSEHQSESASSMAAAVEEMTVSIDQVSEHAREAQNISQSSSELSTRGSDVILKVVEDMRGIAETVHESSAIIEGLGQQSDQIYSIVQVIKEIADQTNLLALNAAIEAARAGEQGRGFAVVADEVRKLAERTTRSTQEIATMIQKIQGGTKQAVASMGVGVERVNQGVSLAGQAGDAIRQIQSGAQRVGVAITDISSALKEQSIASSEIARHVEQVAQMSDENHTVTRGNAKSALHLEELAMNLQGAVEKFKV